MVQFVEISEEAFHSWWGPAVHSYASDKVRSGNDSEEGSVERAEKEFKSLLPEGRSTKNNYIYSLVDEKNNVSVGILWVNTENKNMPGTAFIYDIEIYEQYRGKGYGRAALILLEEKVKELGKEKISLHVFGHNERARKLYELLGYKETNIMMAKELRSE